MSKQKGLQLGSKVTDQVTGFTGIVTAICQYLYGTTSYCVEAFVDAAGKISEERWYHPMRLKVIED